MKYRHLGTSEIKVSEIGFGGWAIGGAVDFSGVPVGWSDVDVEQARRALERAFDLGVNFFDTADIYGLGRSEELIGQVFAGRRDQVVLATKAGIVRTPDGGHRKDFSPAHLRSALDRSLRRLQTDYVDVFQLHNPPADVLAQGEVTRTLEDLQREGKTRLFGVSVTQIDEGLTAIDSGHAQVLQVLYNILNQKPDDRLLPYSLKKGIGIIARVPLASGVLTGKMNRQTQFPADDIRRNFLTPKRLGEAIDIVEEVRRLLVGTQITLAQAALRFVLANPAVSVVIPGAKNPQQVEENISASEARLSPDIVSILHERFRHYNFYLRYNIPV